MTYDTLCLEAVAASPNKAISWWLMAAYRYEIANDPVLSDWVFDEIARFIGVHWDTLNHPHKDLLRSDCLKSAGHLAKTDYPQRVLYALETLCQ